MNRFRLSHLGRNTKNSTNNGDGEFTKYNTSDKKTVLEPIDDAATFNMSIGWRMPTEAEFRLLMDSTTCKWVTDYRRRVLRPLLVEFAQHGQP